jgi:hypothetical protein
MLNNNFTNQEKNNNNNKNNKLIDESNNEQLTETNSDPDILQITDVPFIQRIGARTEQFFNAVFQ